MLFAEGIDATGWVLIIGAVFVGIVSIIKERRNDTDRKEVKTQLALTNEKQADEAAAAAKDRATASEERKEVKNKLSDTVRVQETGLAKVQTAVWETGKSHDSKLDQVLGPDDGSIGASLKKISDWIPIHEKEDADRDVKMGQRVDRMDVKVERIETKVDTMVGDVKKLVEKKPC